MASRETVPAFDAARLLAGPSPTAARRCEEIDYASVVLTTMLVPASAVGRPLDASGFLVPRVERMLMTACTWASSKWSHLAAPGRIVLRVSAGRYGDERALQMEDEELVEQLLGELGETMHLRGYPSAWKVTRWERSFPQYAPGHLDRVAEIERALAADAPRIQVAGAAYRGVGIPACVNQGEQAAQAVMADIGAPRAG